MDDMDEHAEHGGTFELLAASLRADQSDMSTWMAALGMKLAGALPGRVTLRRGGVLGNGPIRGLVANLGTWRFALRMEHGQPVAERAHIVRGIALKTEALPLDAWIESLSAALAELAATSARERAAILTLLA
ncbi:MAG: hypothetical protein IVW57_07065 [Ktedonobacterales bacterium]|nr:hypothetical protein [Ktedonobacterales bacterium]